MAKTKYKIGTFVKVAESESTAVAFGAVEKIIIDAEGVSYQITSIDEPVKEDEIATAYREYVSRPRAKTAAKTRKKKVPEDRAA